MNSLSRLTVVLKSVSCAHAHLNLLIHSIEVLSHRRTKLELQRNAARPAPRKVVWFNSERCLSVVYKYSEQ